MHSDKYFISKALNEAKKALIYDEVPVGAIIVKDDKIISKAFNLKEKKHDVTAHAEILAIKKASKKLRTWHLDNCILYVTLEPCAMCASAILQSRIKKVIYGALDFKGGAIQSTLKLYEVKGFNHYPETMYYSSNEECGKIISNYFKTKR